MIRKSGILFESEGFEKESVEVGYVGYKEPGDDGHLDFMDLSPDVDAVCPRSARLDPRSVPLRIEMKAISRKLFGTPVPPNPFKIQLSRTYCRKRLRKSSNFVKFRQNFIKIASKNDDFDQNLAKFADTSVKNVKKV